LHCWVEQLLAQVESVAQSLLAAAQPLVDVSVAVFVVLSPVGTEQLVEHCLFRRIAFEQLVAGSQQVRCARPQDPQLTPQPCAAPGALDGWADDPGRQHVAASSQRGNRQDADTDPQPGGGRWVVDLIGGGQSLDEGSGWVASDDGGTHLAFDLEDGLVVCVQR
jgi:hypothetical protein